VCIRNNFATQNDLSIDLLAKPSEKQSNFISPFFEEKSGVKIQTNNEVFGPF